MKRRKIDILTEKRSNEEEENVFSWKFLKSRQKKKEEEKSSVPWPKKTRSSKFWIKESSKCEESSVHLSDLVDEFCWKRSRQKSVTKRSEILFRHSFRFHFSLTWRKISLTKKSCSFSRRFASILCCSIALAKFFWTFQTIDRSKFVATVEDRTMTAECRGKNWSTVERTKSCKKSTKHIEVCAQLCSSNLRRSTWWNTVTRTVVELKWIQVRWLILYFRSKRFWRVENSVFLLVEPKFRSKYSFHRFSFQYFFLKAKTNRDDEDFPLSTFGDRQCSARSMNFTLEWFAVTISNRSRPFINSIELLCFTRSWSFSQKWFIIYETLSVKNLSFMKLILTKWKF